MPDENKSYIKQPTQLEQLKLDEIQKSIWLKASREDFISLIKDVVDHLNNDKYKVIVDSDKYDLKNAKKVLLKVINKKNAENEARKLFHNLIKPDIVTLMNSTSSRRKYKINNILSTLSNAKSVVFDSIYFNYYDKPESKSEKYFAERTKLKNQRLKEIIEKEKMIDTRFFEEYFGYSSPSAM